MGLIREPVEIDMSTKSEPWTEKELAEFREIMQQIKTRNAKRIANASRLKKSAKQTAIGQ